MGILYTTVDFFSNGQCLGFKQNNMPVKCEIESQRLEVFALYKQRIEIPLCHKCAFRVHEPCSVFIEGQNVSLSDPVLLFHGRNMMWSASLGFLLTHRMPWHGPLAAPTSPAPGRDSTGSAPHSLHSLFLMGVCDMLLRHYSISVCLYTGALAYCIYRLQQQFKRLCRAGEAMHSGSLCAVGNRPITCLMKAVRRQIWRFASPHSDTMG